MFNCVHVYTLIFAKQGHNKNYTVFMYLKEQTFSANKPWPWLEMHYVDKS